METPLEKAKRIISQILYITIATVSTDGVPWNTPVYSAFDENYNFYWTSDPNARHSQNILENNKVALVIYDSTVPEGTGEGVYIEALASMVEDVSEMERVLPILYSRKNKQPRTPGAFLGESPVRMYKAVPQKVWVNGSKKVNDRSVDNRTEVNLHE